LYGNVPSDVINVYQPPGTDSYITFKSPRMRGRFKGFSVGEMEINRREGGEGLSGLHGLGLVLTVESVGDSDSQVGLDLSRGRRYMHAGILNPHR
jgi:hypothetical protein